MALPGSLSLSSVIEIHAALEGVAVGFFVALVVFDVLAHLNEKRKIIFERIALVSFGIAVLAEVAAYPYSRRIDTLSSEANAVLNKEAGDARKDAGVAMERASNANERASKNEKEAAGLRKAAEDEHLGRVRLQERLVWQGPRDIAIFAAEGRFKNSLKRFAGQRFRDSVGSEDMPKRGLVNFSEVVLAENSLMVVLSHSGWIVVVTPPSPPSFPSPRVIKGMESQFVSVAVRLDAPKRTREAAVALRSILNSVLWENTTVREISPTPGDPDQQPADVIEVHVGRHPDRPERAKNQ